MKIECMPKENDTDEDVIRKICAINGFNCNLYVLVNFAAQAESGLKLLDQNILEMNDIENSPFIIPIVVILFRQQLSYVCQVLMNNLGMVYFVKLF